MVKIRLREEVGKVITIEPGQLQALENVARQRGTTEGQVLREILRKALPSEAGFDCEVLDTYEDALTKWLEDNNTITVIQAADVMETNLQTARRKLDKWATRGKLTKKKDRGNKYLYYDNRVIDPPGMPSLEEMLAAPSADEEYLKAEEAKAEALSKIKEVKFD